MTARPLAALAWRESRFARRRLLLFLSSISLGVAALVATQGFAANLASGVRDQARTLLGADVALRSTQPFGPKTEQFLAAMDQRGVAVARVTSFVSMGLVPRTGATRLVQVRAIQGGFPFYGTIETRPAGLWRRWTADRNALVDPGLLVALGARVGDTLALGEGRFRIAGTLEKVPGDVGISTVFAPRVFIPARFLPETGLMGFGSRVEREAFLRLPRGQDAEGLVSANERSWEEERVRARTAEGQQRQLSESLTRLGRYLGLIGTFALLLGGIGVASAMRAYIAQKIDTVATLRCLGASSRQVLGIYLLQAAGMGLAGAALGAVAGASVQWILPRLLSGLLPVEVQTRPDAVALLTGIGLGTWVAVAFALIPLLATRRISPLQALRRRVEMLPGGARRPDGWTVGAWTLLAASIAALILLQVRELRIGLGFVGGIAAVLAALWLLAWAGTRATRRLRGKRLSFPVRQGIANLHRPGNQTRTVVLALGFGVFLLATLYGAQYNMLRPLRGDARESRANLVFFDVQADQQTRLAALIRDSGFGVLDRTPIVPMRVASINGRSAARPRPERSDEPGDRRPEGWAVRREYRSTFRDTLVGSERLVRGAWWDRDAGVPNGPAPVSLEEDIAGDLAVGLGDRIVWDVQGVRIPTQVASIREVDWARFEPNFFAVFPPAVLSAAPHTWVLLARVPEERDRALLQARAVQRFPNVSAVDLTQVQRALDQVLDRVAAVVQFLAGFSIATGFIVLLGAVGAGRLQRIRESVLLRTLGATRRQIGASLVTEYLLLGMVASVAGIALSLAAGWALARWVFQVPFGAPAVPLLLLGVGISVLAAAVGLWASRETFRFTPLEMLRDE